MALEEPELHVPPSLQRRLVHRLQALSSQTFISTHSPAIAALASPTDLVVIRNDNGILSAVPFLPAPLPQEAVNGVRKLFQVNRVETVSALMHDVLMVPEGRTDFEWLGLLVRAVDLHQGWEAGVECKFDSSIVVIPTHDAAVLATINALTPLHPRIVALVDGDEEGVGYAGTLSAQGQPNSGLIIRWANGEMLEDAIGWIVSADEQACLAAMHIADQPHDMAALVMRLKSKERHNGGLKADTLTYEDIANAIGLTAPCRERARTLLNALELVARGEASPLFPVDPDNAHARVFHP
jgi:hypothetical protein